MVTARWGLVRRVGAFVGRALGRLAVVVVVGALVLVAAAGAVGRLRLVPAPSRTSGTAYSQSDVIVVVPVPAQRLRVGDVVIVHNKQEHALFRVAQIVDSEGPQVRFANDVVMQIEVDQEILSQIVARIPTTISEQFHEMRSRRPF